MGSPAFLVSKISPGEAPRTTLQEEIHGGNFGSHFIYSIKPLRHAAPPAPAHLTPVILMRKTLLFAGHLPMIIYDFGIRGFICWGMVGGPGVEWLVGCVEA